MTEPEQRRVHLVLVGPTASGKSALALELARRLPGPPVELLSVDSMQVYRGMDVGTAKPTAEERIEVPHHLIDLADPGHDFSVAEFQTAAAQALAGIASRGHRALLVGGTGLYLSAILDGLKMPGRWPEVRAELENEPDTATLHRRLVELDPLAAARMTSSNRRRVLRALEVTIGSGRPFSSFGPGLAEQPVTKHRLAGVWLPRPVVATRIRERVQAMVSAGLVEEVRSLSGRADGLSRTARQALGYREILAHLAGRCTLEDALEETIRRTRAFSRRQRMWFRRDSRITWYGSASDPFAVLPALLGDWSHP